jgi:methylthioribose-1-phosphate isomerase
MHLTDVENKIHPGVLGGLGGLAAVELDDALDTLVILDQTELPGQLIYRRLTKLADMHEAIASLRVRGAPAIGIAAAYATYLAVKRSRSTTLAGLGSELMAATEYLATSRPTAVNLFWALRRMQNCLKQQIQASLNQTTAPDDPVPDAIIALRNEARAIHAEDARVCRAIGEYGLTLIRTGDGILTHCNAGQLAASRYGTALAPIYLAHEHGYNLRVFVDETRPLLQGARLTAYELQAADVDVTLICDNMAATVMQKRWIQAICVGCL